MISRPVVAVAVAVAVARSVEEVPADIDEVASEPDLTFDETDDDDTDAVSDDVVAETAPSGVARTSGVVGARTGVVGSTGTFGATTAVADTLFDPDEDEGAPVEPFVAPTTSNWTPPVTTSWVNLGASTTAPAEAADADDTADSADSNPQESDQGDAEHDDSEHGVNAETDQLESESGGGAGGRRRRMSRWRLRP